MQAMRDTICALSSGAPPAALAIIRISGPDTCRLADIHLKSGCPSPRRVAVTDLLDCDGQTIDHIVAVFMPGPHSFTGDDILELIVHGSAYIIEETLSVLRLSGARLAGPGEFSRRAFEAGKLDLTRAEAIADLIDAESAAQHKQALLQYNGALAEIYDDWHAQLTDILALLEVSIDFPDEHDAPTNVDEPAKQALERLSGSLASALAGGNITERIRDGFQVVILGAPNSGKSTLLNQLSGRDTAIVTDRPGTTRDILEVRLNLGGYIVRLMDTAGIRETDDEIEAEGVARAHRAAQDADVRIWLYDVRDGLDAIYQPAPDDICVANKLDLSPDSHVSRETVRISAKQGDGISELVERITQAIARRGAAAPAPVITRLRHRQGIEEAQVFIGKAIHGLDHCFGAEFVAADVRSAARALSGLTGAVDTEEILGAVFSSFCIGK